MQITKKAHAGKILGETFRLNFCRQICRPTWNNQLNNQLGTTNLKRPKGLTTFHMNHYMHP